MASYKSPSLLGPTEASVCVRFDKTLPLLHVAVVVLCRLWNLELGEPLFVSLLRTGTEDIQWKLVGTGRQEGKTSGKGKGVHTKQQHNGAQAVNSPDAYANGEN